LTIKLGTSVLLCAGIAALAAPAAAQWPPHATPNVPRTADGRPDLDAPPPRTADGHVDLSGIWERYGGFAASENAAQDADRAPDVPPAATFFDLGANFEGGLPYRPWARELRDQRVADGMKDNPDANCLPLGHMQLHMHPQPRKIIQLPDLVVIIWEANYGLRQIFLDGRGLPDNDPLPWWYGYSIGYWDGDTLVVETSHLRDGGWLDVNGSPLTSHAKITERLTRVTYGHMIIDVTIDDPVAYTKPFTVRVENGIMLDTNLIEFICNENEKSTRYFDP
jgi:hypothetical protein